MQLYTLLFGLSKKRMHPIMIDAKHKCENYRDKRKNSGNASKAARGHYEIIPADKNAVPWKRKTATIGGNKDNSSPRRIGEKLNGYITKHGFNPHT